MKINNIPVFDEKFSLICDFYKDRKDAEASDSNKKLSENTNFYIKHKDNQEIQVIYNSNQNYNDFLKLNVSGYDPSLSIMEDTNKTHKTFLLIDNHLVLKEIVEEPEEISKLQAVIQNKHNYSKALKIGASGLLGIGTGLAMMPIFNNSIKGLKAFDIDIHDKEALFVISTINTLLVYSYCNIVVMYKFLSQDKILPDLNQEEPSKGQKLLKNVGLPLSLLASIQPVIQLWEVENNNKKVDGSDGFDQFMAWATFTTLPLLICKAVNTYDSYSKTITNYKYKNLEIDSIGAKLVTYGLSGLSLVGRGISYTTLTKYIMKELGCSEEVATSFGIILGGIGANLLKGFNEFHTLQSLFEKKLEKTTFCDYIKAVISTAEGVWFALPMTIIGVNAINDMNSILKSALFTPLFLSTLINEATTINQSIGIKKTINHTSNDPNASLYENILNVQNNNEDNNQLLGDMPEEVQND